MNTKDDWKTTARIYDGPRRAKWISIFPDAVVPIKSILTCRVNVPGHRSVDAYMLDLDAISDEQREAVAKLLAESFGILLDEVRVELDQGVPILADGVVVTERDQGMLFSMIHDDVDRGMDSWWRDEHEDYSQEDD